MTRQKLTNLYEWGIKTILILTPLLFLLIDKGSFFPYVAPRAFWFRLLIEIAFALAVGLTVLRGRFKWRSLDTAVIAFLAIIGIANILGVNPYRSFWSRLERMDGYLNLIHLVMFFLAARVAFKNPRDWQRFFYAILGVSVIEFGYASLQKLGEIQSIIGGFRAEGTFGNPTYLAAFALFAFGIAIMLLVQSKETWQRWLLGSVAVLNLVSIYMTATRGVVVGLFVGGLVFTGLVWLIKTNSKLGGTLKKASLVGVGVFILAAAGLWFFREASFINNNETLRRMASISLTDRTTEGRFLVWQLALEGVMERPLFGWGQENFIDVFNKYYDPALYNQETWFDRAHNAVIDWLVSGGVLGLIAYFALFVIGGGIVFRLVRKTGRDEDKLEAAILGALGAAYFTQNLFVFDSMATYILFFALLGYVAFLKSQMEERSTDNYLAEEAVERRRRFSLATAATLLLAVLALAWPVHFKPYVEARELIGAVNFMYEKQTVNEEVLEGFKGVLARNTFADSEVREQLGKIINELLMTSVGATIPMADRAAFVEYVVEEMKKDLEEDPNNLRLKLFLGTIYTRWNEVDETYIDKGNAQLREALKISPDKQQIYFALIENYLVQGAYEKALAVAQAVYELDRRYPAARGNLAYVAAIAEREDVVQEMMAEGLTPPFLAKLGNAYLALQRFPRALEVYELLAEKDEGNPEYRAKLAGLYLNQGMVNRAVEEAKKARELDPKNYTESVEAFLENIRGMGYEVGE